MKQKWLEKKAKQFRNFSHRINDYTFMNMFDSKCQNTVLLAYAIPFHECDPIAFMILFMQPHLFMRPHFVYATPFLFVQPHINAGTL